MEPGQTPSPTAEPTPTPTPAPTINPADIKKASIDFLAGQTADSCSESENDLIHIFWAGKNNDEQINNSGDKAYNYGVTQNDEECRAIDDDKRLVLSIPAIRLTKQLEMSRETLSIAREISGSGNR